MFSLFSAPVKQWLLPWQYYKTRQDNYIHATDEVIRVLEKVNAILEFSGVAVLSLIEFFSNSVSSAISVYIHRIYSF